MADTQFSFTQPICSNCFQAYYGREPYRVSSSRDTIERHYTARRGRQFADRPLPSAEAAEKVRRERIANVLLRPHG